MIDAGCDCCYYLPVGVFDTLEEAEKFVGDDDNLIIDEEDWSDDEQSSLL
jgi:hypothetical protein